MNLLQLRLPQVALFFTLLIIYLINVRMTYELESTFIEVVIPKKSNYIINLTDFNRNYLNKLLLKNIYKKKIFFSIWRFEC